MSIRNSEKRKSQGCSTPLVYFSLQMTAVLILLYIAKTLTIPFIVLAIFFIGFSIYGLNRTSQVCARQRYNSVT